MDNLQDIKKIYIITLGCKVNQYESQIIRESFEKYNIEVTNNIEEAQIVIINSCTVTSRSDQKTRRLIRNIKKRFPNTILVVTGCYAERSEEELKKIKEIDFIFTNKYKYFIPSLLLENNYQCNFNNSHLYISRFKDYSRAFIKIQDGCDSFCSYCIIPYIRKEIKSKPPNIVIKEIKNILKGEVKEIVLVGIHIGKYGKDENYKWNLSYLLKEILKLKENFEFRIRLSSIEVTEITEELIDIIKESKGSIVPHIHIPLQSGDNEILKKMNRHYTIEYFIEKCSIIRKKLKNPAITTDIIVGFPGEKDKNFENTKKAAEFIKFSRTHVFPYSDRKGTKAYTFKDKVPNIIKKERVKELIKIAKKNMFNFHKEFEDKVVEVVVEKKEENNKYSGLSERYIRTYFNINKGNNNNNNNINFKIVKVKVHKAYTDYLEGNIK